MEQDGRPEVEASMRRRRKKDEACSVASGGGSKVRRRRGLGGAGGDGHGRQGLFFKTKETGGSRQNEMDWAHRQSVGQSRGYNPLEIYYYSPLPHTTQIAKKLNPTQTNLLIAWAHLHPTQVSP
jgi:hypothetical protein